MGLTRDLVKRRYGSVVDHIERVLDERKVSARVWAEHQAALMALEHRCISFVLDALDGKEGAGSHVLVQSLRETATCDGEHRWSKCLREAADAIEYWAARSDAFEKEYEQLKARVRNLAGS